MKTPLQELIEWMDEQEYTPPYNEVRRKATELLEKEREREKKIAKHAWNTAIDKVSEPDFYNSSSDFENWYNETYKQNK